MEVSTSLIILSIISFGYLIVLILFLFFRNKDVQNKRRLEFVINTAAYVTTLEHFMAKAYDIIYKEFVLIFSLEATGVPIKEFDRAIKSFIELTIKMLGPSLTKELIDYFGSEETLFFNISEYFTVRYEQDEVRKSATESLMEQEQI